jgi:hypothetical protein
MIYVKTLKFYFNILFQNINILFQCFIQKHQNFISPFYLKRSKSYFNILFKNITIVFHYRNSVHWINRFIFARKGEGGSKGSSCRPGTSFTQRTSRFPVPATFHQRFLIISKPVTVKQSHYRPGVAQRDPGS